MATFSQITQPDGSTMYINLDLVRQIIATADGSTVTIFDMKEPKPTRLTGPNAAAFLADFNTFVQNNS